MARTSCGFSDGTDGTGAALLTLRGPTVLVDIGFDLNTPATAALTGILALVDTGATECCIDNILASTLQLPVVDRRVISGTVGRHTVNVYLAQVRVPALNVVIHGRFAGVDLQAGGQIQGVLMGRTFLQLFTMSYAGRTGKVEITDDLP